VEVPARGLDTFDLSRIAFTGVSGVGGGEKGAQSRLFAPTVHVPPFLSHVPTLKSSEYFAMFSYGPPADWNGPHSMELRCESRYANRLLAAAYANDAVTYIVHNAACNLAEQPGLAHL
jgi:hypothetical protein